jgi:23S rRNA (guanosine2251-2'-O)-methyltransferase
MASSGLKPVVISGRNTVREFLLSGRGEPRELLLGAGADRRRLKDLVELAGNGEVSIREIPPQELERLAGTGSHQGVALKLGFWPYSRERDLPEVVSRGGGAPCILLLDHLKDVGNLGAIIRSAHLTGVDAVVMPAARAAPVTSAVVRASAGAAAHMDIFRVSNLTSAIKRLKDLGLWVYGLEAGGGTSILEADLKGPLAMVLGQEEKGLSRLVRENCDLIVHLPMAGCVGSYNASAAAAVALFEVMRQRMQ